MESTRVFIQEINFIIYIKLYDNNNIKNQHLIRPQQILHISWHNLILKQIQKQLTDTQFVHSRIIFKSNLKPIITEI